MARLNIELAVKGVTQVDKGMKAVSDRVSRLEAEIKTLQAALGGFSRQQQALQGQMAALRASFDAGNISQKEFETENQKLSNAMAKVGGSIQTTNSRLSSLLFTLKSVKDSTNELNQAQNKLTTVHNDFKHGTDSGQSTLIRYTHAQRATLSASNNLARVFSEMAAGGNNVAASIGIVVRQMATASITGGGLAATFKGLGASLIGPTGVVIAISAAVTVITNYITRQRQAAKATKEASASARNFAETLNTLSQSLYNASQSYAKDIARMQTLMAVIKSATATQNQRNAALKDLQDMYPAVFRNFNTETILTEKASEAYKELTNSIIASANAHAAQSMIADKARQQFGLVLENSERQEQLEITRKQIEADQKRADEAREMARTKKDITQDERDQLLRDAAALERSIKSNDKILQLRQEQTDAGKEIADIEMEKRKLEELALSNQLKVNDALLDTSKNTDKATASVRDFVDAIQRVFDFETSSASLINISYTNAEIQKVKNEYEKLLNNVDRLEKEGLRRNENNQSEQTRILQEAERERAEIRRAQAIAVADVIYKQETAALEKSLQEQRDLYENYERWRKELGEESANERYAKEIESIREFATKLQTETAGLLAKGLTPVGLTDSEKSRFDSLMKILKDFNKDRESEENKHLMSLLKLYGSFEEKRKRLAEQYYKDIESLNDEQRKNRARQYTEDLAKEIENEINQSEALKNMDIALDFGSLKKSKAAVKLAQDFIADFFKNLKPTSPQEAAAAKQLEKSLNSSLKRINVALDAKKFDVVTDLVQSFGQLVDLAQEFDGSLGKGLKTVSSMLSEVGSLSKSLGDMLGDAGGGLSKMGGWAGIAGAVVGVVGGIFGAIEARRQKEQEEFMRRLQYMEDYRIKQMERQTKLLQGQYALINDIYGVDRLNAYANVLKDINDERERLLKIQRGESSRPHPDEYINAGRAKILQNTGVEEVDKWIERYNKAVTSANITERQWAGQTLPQIQREAKKAGVSVKELELDFRNLSQMDTVELQSLIDTGTFDENTAKFISTLIDLAKTELDALKALREELTGTSYEALADGLVDIFTRGDSAMDDFEKNFDELMRKSLVQSLKRSIMTDALKDWYEQFASFAQSGGGLDDSEVDQLRRDYQRIGEQIKANAENLERATGISLSPDDSDSVKKGLTGSIQRLSEQTGSELTGLYRAGFELNKQELGYVQRLAISNDGILVAINESSEYLSDIASTNAEIAENTAYLEEIAESLNQVAKNTGGKSQRDLG